VGLVRNQKQVNDLLISWLSSEIISELEATLSATELADAIKQGELLDFDTIAAKLLEQFAE